jgi:predicted RNA-binding Zn-ribbon protein involved in translation (DUF1610 family)
MSKSEAEYTNGVVSTTLFLAKPFTCPACGNRDVKMIGRYERGVAMHFAEGEMKQRQIEEGEPSIRFTHILCPRCCVDYLIEPDTLFQLRAANLELHMQLAKALGKSVVEAAAGERVH